MKTTTARAFLRPLLMVLVAAIGVMAPAASAQFAPGNLVVYRVGSGTGALVNTGSPVFVDEYTPAGSLVQSLAMPSSGFGVNLIASGTAAAEGMLTVSPSGRYVTLTGYDATIPTTGLATTFGGAVNRTIAVIDATTGTTTLTQLSDFASGSGPRSAVTDNGTNLWITGGAGGIRYTTVGSTTSTQINSPSTLLNFRQVNIFGGRLYATTNSAAGGNTISIGTVGTGLPTAASATYATLPSIPPIGTVTGSNRYAYFFADLSENVAGVDTLYIADEGALALSKYTLLSGAWVLSGTVGVDADDYRGLTGRVLPDNSVQLFAVRKAGTIGTGGGELVTITDASGYNGSFTGTPTLLATAAPNTAFRGVGYLSCPVPVVTLQPANQTVCEGEPAFFSVDAANATFQWRRGGVPIDTVSNPSAATSVLQISNVSASDAGAFDCVVTGPCGVGSVTSNAAILTVPVSSPRWSRLGSGTNNEVRAVAVLPGGDVIVGGDFTTAGGVPANRIARYHPTTGVWSALGSGTNNFVSALAVLPGGDVIVGGDFSLAGGVPANNIARYNPTTNTWSALGSGTNSTILALAVLPSGDVIVGGDFTTAGGVPANRIARYSPTTGVWSALGSGTNNFVSALAVLPGGDVIVGGDFSLAGGVAGTVRIARVNPSTGAWSALASGTDNLVQALAVLPGGDVIVGGAFTIAGGVATNNIARVNPTTGVWSALGSGASGSVLSLVLGLEGDVLVGGSFTTAGGVVGTSRIARYNPGTGTWSALDSGMNSTVFALGVLPSGDVIAGGSFSTFIEGVPANRVARYRVPAPEAAIISQPTPQTVCAGQSATFSVTAVRVGTTSGPVFYQWRRAGIPITASANPSATTATLLLTNLGPGDAGLYDCVVGGDCGNAPAVTSDPALLTVIAPTPAWSAVGAGANGSVRALAVLPSGDVIAGGSFSSAGGVAVSNIARYSVTTNTWSAPGSGTNNTVRALVVLPGGDVIVGGFFTTAGGVTANRVARYNPTTNTWSALGSGTSGDVYALAVLPGGDVIVGGDFTTAGGVTASNLARYNPSTNTWSALGSGTSSTVLALAVLPGGDVLVSGDFTTAGGVTANRVARYNPTTNTWSALGSGTNLSVVALAVLPGGDVIVGGFFTTSGGSAASRIARYNTTTGVWSALGSGMNNAVRALAVLPGGDVLVGGDFTTAGGVTANRIAWYNPSTNTWSALGSETNSTVNALAVLPGGDVIVGGAFTTAGGTAANRIARYTFGAPVPTITTQPAPQTLCVYDAATFSIAISGGTGPFTYQWRKGGVAIDTLANPSAATPTLTLTSVTPADAGSYDCVVSVECGSTTSNAATLTVNICRCNPADIAFDDGSPLPPIGIPGETNTGVTEGDYNLFFANYFEAGAACDIANDDGSPLPPFGILDTNNGVTEGDYNLFFAIFFDGCSL